MGNVKLSIELKNCLTDLDKIKKAVTKLSSAMSCTKRRFMEIDLVLEELFTNVVHHGFRDDEEHEIKLSLSCDESNLMIRMEDDGEPFDLTRAETPDTKCTLDKRCIGGLGIHFVKHFIDECEYFRKKDKNITILKKQIDDETVEAGSASEK